MALQGRAFVDSRTYEKRVWDNYLNTERAAKYYSRWSHILDRRHKFIAFSTAVISIMTIGILQTDFIGDEETKKFAVAFLLLVIGGIELALIHFDFAGNVKVARIYTAEAARLASEWRRLWYAYPNAQEQSYWVNSLETQTRQIALESIGFNKKLSEQCAQEVSDEFKRRFFN